jgi:hypothetical protein
MPENRPSAQQPQEVTQPTRLPDRMWKGRARTQPQRPTRMPGSTGWIGRFVRGNVEMTNRSNEWFARMLLGGREKVRSDRLTLYNLYYFHYFSKLYHDVLKPDGSPTIPYYDQHPLSFIIGWNPDKKLYLGLNLHYVPPKLRYAFVTDVLKANAANVAAQKPLSIPYLWFKARWPHLKVMIHSYIPQRVRYVHRVPINEWEYSIYVDSAKFIGASYSTVWRISRSASVNPSEDQFPSNRTGQHKRPDVPGQAKHKSWKPPIKGGKPHKTITHTSAGSPESKGHRPGVWGATRKEHQAHPGSTGVVGKGHRPGATRVQVHPGSDTHKHRRPVRVRPRKAKKGK